MSAYVGKNGKEKANLDADVEGTPERSRKMGLQRNCNVVHPR